MEVIKDTKILQEFITGRLRSRAWRAARRDAEAVAEQGSNGAAARFGASLGEATAHCADFGRGYGGDSAVPRGAKWLIVAVNENADPARLTLAPFFISGQIQARLGTIQQVL